MGFSMLPKVFTQIFKKPWTNKFPAKYQPSNTTKYLEAVGTGKAKMNPPIPTPDGFRGKIKYDKEKCIGCRICIKVCPCEAIEFKEKDKKIKIYLSRCCFCSQCNDVCPTKCLSMSDEFLLADTDPYSKDLIVE
jgi:formate hydrogenlyase subunit 6/NADH:ubiquinone oxidoreductase subunit I